MWQSVTTPREIASVEIDECEIPSFLEVKYRQGVDALEIVVVVVREFGKQRASVGTLTSMANEIHIA